MDAKDDILKSHDLIDNIERDFSRELGINLVIHLDPVITDDKEINSLKKMTEKVIKSIDESLSIHDFRAAIGETHTNLIFDLEVPDSFKMASSELVKLIDKKVKKENETYFPVVKIDRNYVSTYMNSPKMK